MNHKTFPTPPIPASSLPGPDDTTRVRLSNGIVLLARANFDSPSVIISGHLTAGSLFDPLDKLGLADFTATALLRGAGQLNFQEFFDTLETMGASLGIYGGTHSAGFAGRALVEDLGTLLGLLADALRRPAFPEDEVEKLRAQLLTGLAIRAQDTGDMASLKFDQLLYREHPYGHPEDGYPETVQAITRQDLVDFHRQHYGPGGMAIAVVGGVEASAAVDQVAQVLGDWENPLQPDNPPLPPVEPLQGSIYEKVTLAGKSQADIVMGVVGPERRAPDFMPALVANSVLGQFGLFGRIGDVLREEAGLAYYASSNLGGGMGPGPWYISAGVAPENVEQAVEMLRGEVKRISVQQVTEAELADVKASFIGRMPLSMESNGGVAGALLNIERYNLGMDYYRRFEQIISAITAQQVLEAAAHYLDADRLAIAVSGP